MRPRDETSHFGLLSSAFGAVQRARNSRTQRLAGSMLLNCTWMDLICASENRPMARSRRAARFQLRPSQIRQREPSFRCSPLQDAVNALAAAAGSPCAGFAVARGRHACCYASLSVRAALGVSDARRGHRGSGAPPCVRCWHAARLHLLPGLARAAARASATGCCPPHRRRAAQAARASCRFRGDGTRSRVA